MTNVQGNPTITSEGIIALSQSLCVFQKIQKLRICCSSATTAASAALARSLCTLSSLDELSLSNFKSTEAGAMALMSALSSLTCMEELHLRAMRFGAQAATSLAGSIPYMKGLKKLWLSSNPFGDSGTLLLLSMLQCWNFKLDPVRPQFRCSSWAASKKFMVECGGRHSSRLKYSHWDRKQVLFVHIC